MADNTVVHIGENSPEFVAFKLMKEVACAEGKNLFDGPGGDKPDRAWILKTYAQCLNTVRMPHNVDKYLAESMR